MTDKELRKMNRQKLMEMMLFQSRELLDKNQQIKLLTQENTELRETLERLKSRLDEKDAELLAMSRHPGLLKDFPLQDEAEPQASADEEDIHDEDVHEEDGREEAAQEKPEQEKAPQREVPRREAAHQTESRGRRFDFSNAPQVYIARKTLAMDDFLEVFVKAAELVAEEHPAYEPEED